MSVEATSTLSVHMPGTSDYREATAVYNLFAPVQPDEAVIADSVGRWPPRSHGHDPAASMSR
jgi:hypothetical protein